MSPNHKKANVKRFLNNKTFSIILIYLIPIINVCFLCFNFNDFTKVFVGVLSVLASTAASSACTIRCVDDKEKMDKLSYLRPTSIVLSCIAFVFCLIYEKDKVLYFPIITIMILVLLANVISIYMFIISNNEMENIVEERNKLKEEQNVNKMLEKAKKELNKPKSNIKLTRKGGTKNEK